MYRIFLSAGICLLLHCPSLAQHVKTSIGGRAASLAYATTCLTDEWAVHNNIGGLSKVKNAVVACTFDSQPSFKPFNRLAAAIALPVSVGVAGLGFFRFGDAIYSEQVISVGFSNTFGLASLGIKANYLQYNISGYGSKGVFTVSFGGIASVTNNLSIGAYISNINQPKISKDDGETVPTVLALGISYRLSAQTLILTEAEKDLEYPLLWKSGVEYQPLKKFVFRTAFQLTPASLCFGFGYRPEKIRIDYAFQHNMELGSRHQATIAYHIGNK